MPYTLGHMKTCPYLIEAIGITIENLRRERKLTQTRLADFSALEECYVRSIIKGRKNPSILVIYSICGAMNITLSDFFSRVDVEMKKLKVEETKKPPDGEDMENNTLLE